MCIHFVHKFVQSAVQQGIDFLTNNVLVIVLELQPLFAQQNFLADFFDFNILAWLHSAPPPAPHPAVAEARPEPRLVHPVMATVAPRPAATQQAPYAGSSLGMARTAAPVPQPTPVGASQWVNNGGGGG